MAGRAFSGNRESKEFARGRIVLTRNSLPWRRWWAHLGTTIGPRLCPKDLFSVVELVPLRRVAPRAYLFSVVGTSRCDVRAACSGATSSTAGVARQFVPPATTRAGTARRAVPTMVPLRYTNVSSSNQSRCVSVRLNTYPASCRQREQ